MKTSGALSFFLFFTLIQFSFGQNFSGEKNNPLENVNEKVFLHINSTFLLSGENLFYKFYVLDAETGKFSGMSKTGIVELLNDQKEKVFQHQIELGNGTGNFGFFIPANLPSGSYKLIGYTNLMNNFENNYYKQDLFILNPYQQLDKNLVGETKSASKTIESSESEKLQLRTDKDLYRKREKVLLNFIADNHLNGQFSISIRKIDSFPNPEKLTAGTFHGLYKNIQWQDDAIYIPELRGNLIEGEISGPNNEKYIGRVISISFPGEENAFEVTTVGEDGRFYFNLEKEPQKNIFLAQLLGPQKEDVQLSISQPSLRSYSGIEYPQIKLNASLKDEILPRSVFNQIQNAYFFYKTDSTIASPENDYFFGNKGELFNLDEFQRFDEVQKTFIEVISNARVRTDSQGRSAIFISHINPADQFEDPAFLLVDGVSVQDHEKLLFFPSNRIKSIRIIRDPYFLGPVIFDGIVVVETKEGNFPVHFREDTMFEKEIFNNGINYDFYSPDYEEAELSRIPDYRLQLLWEPTIVFSGKELLISFFTSDVAGKFEINLEGFTSEGESVSLKNIFQVQ